METPLRKARERRGIRQKDVAQALSIDQGYLSRIEKATRTCTPELAEKIAEYFGDEVTEMQILYPERYMNSGEQEPTA